MKTILKGSFTDLKNNILHFLSICFFMFFSIIIFSSMISTSYQLYFSFQNIDHYSLKYDYSINVNKLSLLNKNIAQFPRNSWAYNFQENIFNDFGLNNRNPKSPLSLEELNRDLVKSNCYVKIINVLTKPERLDITFNNKATEDKNFTPNNRQQKNIVGLFLSYFDNLFLKKDNSQQYVLHIKETGFLQYLLNRFLNEYNQKFATQIISSNVHSFFYKKIINQKLFFFKIELANNNISSYHFLQTTTDSKTKKTKIINIGQKKWQNKLQINLASKAKFKNNNFLIRKNALVLKDNNQVNFHLKNNQILVVEQFADYNNFQINDSLALDDNLQTFINGFGESENNIYPQTQAISINSSKINDQYLKNGSFIFTNLNLYYYLRNEHNASWTDNQKILLKFKNAKKIKRFETAQFFYDLNYGLFNILFNNYLNTLNLFAASQSGWIKNNVQTILVIQTSVAFVVFFVILMVLFFFLKRYIDGQKQRIGFLKALGVKNSKLSIIFTMPLAIIIFISTWIGYFFGIFLQIYFSHLFIYSIGTNLTPLFFGIYLFIAIFLILPILFIIITYYINILNLNKNIITLIYDFKVQDNIKIQRNHFYLRDKLKFSKIDFNFKLSFSFLRNTFWKFIFIMAVFTGTIFLFFFEVSTNIYNHNFQINSYNYVNKNVKTKEVFNVDQYLNAFKNKNKFDFWTDKKIIKNLQPLDFNSTGPFVIQQPVKAVIDLYIGENHSNANDFKKGDKTTPNPVFGRLVHFFYLNKTNYITSADTKKILNTEIKNIFSKSKEKMLFWDWLIKYKKKIIEDIEKSSGFLDISSSKLNYLFILAHQLKNYAQTSDNNYPKIFLGNHYVYNSENEALAIEKEVKWNLNIHKSIYQYVPNLNLISIKKNQLNKFWNLKFRSQNLNDDLKKFWTDHQYLDDWSQAKNNVLNIFVSLRIQKANNFVHNQIIKLRTKLFNNYVDVKYRILGFINNDISSNNIYINYQNLNNYISAYAHYKFKFKRNFIKQYDNFILVKYQKNFANFIKQFRNISIISKVNKYQHNKTNLNGFADGITSLLTKNMFTTLTSFTNIISYKLLDVINNLGTKNVNKMLYIIEVFTGFAIFFTLLLLIKIIFDQHNMIILILKAFGYSSRRLCYLILGFYFVFMVLNLLLAWLLSKAFWGILANYIFSTSGVYFPVFFSLTTLAIISFLVIITMIFLFYFGYKFINKKSISNISLLQT